MNRRMSNSSVTAPAKGVAVASLAFVSRPSAALEAAAPIAGEPSPIVARAAEQFGIFVGRLRAYGLSVSDVPVSAAPLGACIGDTALLLPQGAILMRPSDAGRRPEVAAVEDALKRAGFAILGRIEPPGLLDGGDVLVAGTTVYIGVPEHRRQLVGIPVRGPRGNEHGRRQLSVLAGSLGYKAVNVSFSADVERLRSVCSAVDDETVISSAQLVDTPAFAGMKLVSIDSGDDYGAGVLRVAPRRVIVNVRFRSVVQALRRVKVAADSIDLWEFGKAGIAPSLLALLPAGT
jgi:dimethylargininase